MKEEAMSKKIKLKPFCQCVQLTSGTITPFGRETTTSDGETCDKCEHYVVWKNPERLLNRKNKTQKDIKKQDDAFYLEEYTVGM